MNEVMRHFDYSAKNYVIREDMPDTYREVWNKIAHAGNWWRGVDRVAIAKEVRAARHCNLCKQRKAALSPYSVKGSHDSESDLPGEAVDAVHRLATDASRLTLSWLKKLEENGLSQEQYVELLGVVVAVISIDGFHRAMGFALEPLPASYAGEPIQYRPASARSASGRLTCQVFNWQAMTPLNCTHR